MFLKVKIVLNSELKLNITYSGFNVTECLLDGVQKSSAFRVMI